MVAEKREQESEEELIRIKWHPRIPYRWKVGHFLGRFFREMRDNKRMVGVRCPECKEILFPPWLVCARCHVRTEPELIEMPDKGRVVTCNPRSMKLWHPWKGEWLDDPHPAAVILLDNGVYAHHKLEETDLNKIKTGMRVQAVWKENPQGQGMSDIRFFRTIEEDKEAK